MPSLVVVVVVAGVGLEVVGEGGAIAVVVGLAAITGRVAAVGTSSSAATGVGATNTTGGASSATGTGGTAAAVAAVVSLAIADDDWAAAPSAEPRCTSTTSANSSESDDGDDRFDVVPAEGVAAAMAMSLLATWLDTEEASAGNKRDSGREGGGGEKY